MKRLLPIFLLFIIGLSLKGQTSGDTEEGTISFVTSQNVYVKFQSTANISLGDTLYMMQAAKINPVLVVKALSSISCVCIPLSKQPLAVADKILSRKKVVKQEQAVIVESQTIIPAAAVQTDTVQVKKEIPATLKQHVSGRISLSSYSNFSGSSDFSQRMRYNLSLDAQNLGNSKLSGETYISFVHKINEWSEVKNDIFNGLKIYSLSLNYAFNRNNSVSVGRKVNPRLSNVGAIDGLQYETKLKPFSAGVFAGTRPDYMNYSFNANLLQYGGYFGHDYVNKQGGNMQTSIAFVEQQNNGNTDRRFAYLQHSNSLLKKLYFFGSIEFDLYNKKKVITAQDTSFAQNNTPNLSNLYVSLRYKLTRQLSLSLSYSERQNIIYYETYKSIVDQLLEDATMKGYMFQVNYHPLKLMTIGANAGYRFSKQDPKPSKNLYTYLTYSVVPLVHVSATLSATLLETVYLSGRIYSLGFSRDIIPGKLNGGASYRYVKYTFQSAETPVAQNMAEMDLTWRIMKKLSCSVNYEGTFEKGNNYSRIYVNVTQRF